MKLLVLAAMVLTTVTGGLAQSSNLPDLATPREKHLRNVHQLTFGGQNAEAYFSADDKMLIFQHQGTGVPCDQIYTMPVDTPDGKPATPKLVSTGKGRTTCSYFFPQATGFFFLPRMRRARNVLRSPITRADTFGPSTTPTTSIPRSRMAVI